MITIGDLGSHDEVLGSQASFSQDALVAESIDFTNSATAGMVSQLCSKGHEKMGVGSGLTLVLVPPPPTNFVISHILVTTTGSYPAYSSELGGQSKD